jgi:hypothetical protein
MIKSERENNIDKFIDSIMTQNEWEKNIKKKINYFTEKYKNELEDYIYIKNIEMYNKIPLGSYIRYFNFNNELKWGGILLKKYKSNDFNIMLVINSSYKINKLSFQKNYVFYKKKISQSDKTRKLFLSFLEKYNN